MFKAIAFTVFLFVVVFGSIKGLKGLNIFQLETLLAEFSFAAGVTLAVAMIIAALVILF